ncbi:MAG: SDR family NAD(P)-dependent oxidoreductase [Firmicutes bacterium]|nr:SDR family NAD(P)-dependent oxidoreductase [Bacillota bacterium]
MGAKLLGIDKDQLFAGATQPVEVEEISSREIAVIGMAGRFGAAANIEEFWQALQAGKDFIQEYPLSRQTDSDRLADFWGNTGKSNGKSRYSQGAYLKAIDQFDPQLFNISPLEARLMDPHQRIFLETVWAALEDAGYGGARLSGTKTGVFIGHSSDFGCDYRYLINFTAPSQWGLSVPGNIQSIIASRIAYLLDFRGPSILVNTACSSSLTAIHLACRSIRNGECELAVAGGVKLALAPFNTDENEAGIRILSVDGRARTFDDSSDGTGIGEGAGAVLLKPLKRALLDGDHIYAVIKGSAINQDGNSVGITAPNSAAQEEVILLAWKDADIPPETISYIETHGTGTKLGDPIEISGIQKAFRHYTDKKQFCAVASVKTNVGHLDHAAGIVAFIKAALALKNKQIPPSLHFEKPNRKIDFTDSPVYVNDRLRDWEASGSPRRCGISSFGLSGTNCHLVLEEAPPVAAVHESPLQDETSRQPAARILALSAKNGHALLDLVKRYQQIISKGIDGKLDALCYTANTGRGHYESRLAVIFTGEAELRKKIAGFLGRTPAADPENGIFYGHFKLIATPNAKLRDGEIDGAQKDSLDQEAGRLLKQLAAAAGQEKYNLLSRLGGIYVQGAEIQWEELYRGHHYQKISLPEYPFQRKRYWIEPSPEESGLYQSLTASTPAIHPLIDRRLAESLGIELYITSFSPRRHWVLNEHKVAGIYVAPGTAYLEMASEIGWRHYPGQALELRDIFFITPLALAEDETKEVQTVVKLEKDHLGFAMISRAEDGIAWVTHAEGKIYSFHPTGNPGLEFTMISQEFKNSRIYQTGGTEKSGAAIETGPRWETLKKIHFDSQRALACFELKPEFISDLLEHKLHPALMDSAVNIGVSSGSDGLYLPFSYRSLKIHRPLSGKVYSYLRKNTKPGANQETISVDITLWDEMGAIIAEIENYTVKKAPRESLETPLAAGRELYFDIGWIPKPLHIVRQGNPSGAAMIFLDKKGSGAAIVHEFTSAGVEVIEVMIGPEYRQISANQFTVGWLPEDYQKLCGAVRERKITRIIHLGPLSEGQWDQDADSFTEGQRRGLESLFHLTKGLIQNKISGPISLTLIASYGSLVTGDEPRLNPLNAAFFGLGKVISQEHEHLQCRSIDIDDQVGLKSLMEEITAGDEPRVAYRNNNRYVEEFRPLDRRQLRPRTPEINDQGVYVITGGTGGLGLEIGKYLSSKHKVNLCLLNRTPFPGRKDWPEILSKNEDRKLCRKIEAIQAIENNGSEVCIYPADVSSAADLEPVFNELRSKYGRIKGIVHCAGVAGDGFIFRKAPTLFEQVISPKIKGTWVLDQLTRGDSLDFIVLFSSVTAFLGGAGQGDYTAANAFLDSFAAYRNQKGFRTLAINWPVWKETGMAVDYGAHQAAGMFKPLSTALAIKAFDEVFNLDLARVIIGELDYQTIAAHQDRITLAFPPELDSLVRRKAKMPAAGQRTEKRLPQAGMVGKGKEETGYSEIEQKVAQIWAFVLGLEEVNINDDFYQLGGDSILATRLLKEMEKEYPGLVDITDIFTYQTAAQMAAYLERKLRPEKGEPKAKNSREEELDRILASLANGQISAEEADRLIKSRSDKT